MADHKVQHLVFGISFA